MNMHEIIPNSR